MKHSIAKVTKVRDTELCSKVPDVCKPVSRESEVNFQAFNQVSFRYTGRYLRTRTLPSFLLFIDLYTARLRDNALYLNLINNQMNQQRM